MCVRVSFEFEFGTISQILFLMHLYGKFWTLDFTRFKLSGENFDVKKINVTKFNKTKQIFFSTYEKIAIFHLQLLDNSSF